MNQQLLEKSWLKFANQVLPLECSKTQYEEMRMAFFAGAGSLLMMLANLPDTMDEDETMHFLKLIEDEFTADMSYQIDRLTHSDLTTTQTSH